MQPVVLWADVGCSRGGSPVKTEISGVPLGLIKTRNLLSVNAYFLLD